MRHRTRARPLIAVLAVLCAAALGGHPAQSAELTYLGFFDVATGDYTLSEDTRSAALFSSLVIEAGRFEVTASLPLVYQDTPFVTYVGGARVPTGRQRHAVAEEQTGSSGMMGSHGGPGGPGRQDRVPVPDPDTLRFDETGVGDPLVRVEAALRQSDDGGGRVALWGALKAPLADFDRGFGTGEWDAGAGVLVHHRLGGRATLLAELGYWSFGDPPGLTLEDPLAYSVGVAFPVRRDRDTLLASVLGWTETIEGTDGPVSLALTYRRASGPARGVGITLTAGVTETAPDFALGLGWDLKIRRGR